MSDNHKEAFKDNLTNGIAVEDVFEPGYYWAKTKDMPGIKMGGWSPVLCKGIMWYLAGDEVAKRVTYFEQIGNRIDYPLIHDLSISTQKFEKAKIVEVDHEGEVISIVYEVNGASKSTYIRHNTLLAAIELITPFFRNPLEN